MYKIEAIIREEKMEEVKEALSRAGVTSLTLYQVMGCGSQKGYMETTDAPATEILVRPKIKFEIVVPTREWEEKITETIRRVANTGHIGDGKIFIYNLENAVKIRTGEEGSNAI